MRLVASRAGWPTRSPASVFGVHWTANPTPPTSITAASGATAVTRPATLAIIRASPVRRCRRSSAPPSGAACSRRGDLRSGAAAPDVADREGERVRRIGRPGRGFHPKKSRHHRGDLRLVGLTRTGDGRLYFARRIRLHRQAGLWGGQHGHRAGLRRTHHGAHVVLTEHALDGDRIRLVLTYQVRETAIEMQQPLGELIIGVAVHHVVSDQRARPARFAFDDADAAAGEAGIDTEHAHDRLPPKPTALAVRVFDTLPHRRHTPTARHATLPTMQKLVALGRFRAPSHGEANDYVEHLAVPDMSVGTY